MSKTKPRYHEETGLMFKVMNFNGSVIFHEKFLFMNRSGGHYVLEGPIIIRGGWCLKIVEPITIRLLVKITVYFIERKK